MKQTPLLDFWQKPEGAGEPVALFATTFALETDFFEQHCLARFLEITSVNEDTGSVEDIVANIELYEQLQKIRVTVLADRSASVQRTSLLWDVLSCKVEGALLHSKVVVLMWEKATRVILGSMNLTSAGYRRQIELGLAVDLGENCLFPVEVLQGIHLELESYLPLVPGYQASLSIFDRANDTLNMFGERIAQQKNKKGNVLVAFAPTNATEKPLEKMREVWRGGLPLRATHLSPFWDSGNTTVLEMVGKQLTGRPASKRAHRVAVVLGPRGQISLPRSCAIAVDEVLELESLDNESRLLHAKCLVLESHDWVAVLVGSSNHTLAGLGVSARPHREMNVWLGAARDSQEGRALRGLIQLAKKVEADAEEVEQSDEDEIDLPSLPACFELCRVSRLTEHDPWMLVMGIKKTADMPQGWSIRLAGSVVLTRSQWEKDGGVEVSYVSIEQTSLPMSVFVKWGGYEVPWSVVVDDRHELPPGPALSSLRAQHLLQALAMRRSLGAVLRDEGEQRGEGMKTSFELDPLKRHDQKGTLLRKGRELSVSLNEMQDRLARQVLSLETLRARLAGPLGPVFVATKVVEACEAKEQTPAEALFTVAEIALSLGRVNWRHVLEQVDPVQGLAFVVAALEKIIEIRSRIVTAPSSMAAYADRAMKEARLCVQS